MDRLKFFYSIFAFILLTLNLVLNGSSVDIPQLPIPQIDADEITTITQTNADSQQYALPPSIMYSSIDRTHRRKFLFDMSMCFSESGAFAFLVIVTITKFYELFVSAHSQDKSIILPKIVKDDNSLGRTRYCESSSVLII